MNSHKKNVERKRIKKKEVFEIFFFFKKKNEKKKKKFWENKQERKKHKNMIEISENETRWKRLERQQRM